MASRTLIGDYFENLPLRFIKHITRPMPAPMRGQFSGWLGRRILRNVPSLRGRVDANLRLIYPDMSSERRYEILTAVGDNLGRSFLEILYAQKFLDSAARITVSGEAGLEAIAKCKRDGLPAIGVTGHFGPWEASRIFLQGQGIKAGSIYRPLHNRFSNEDLLKCYKVFGEPLFPKGKSGTRGAVRHLLKGGFLCLMHDQKMRDGEILDFMGQPALTSTVIADLALKFKAPLIPAYAIRQADGYAINLELEAPIPHSTSREMSQALNDSLAARVHEHPEQWYWLHKRWGIGSKKQKSVSD